MMSRWVSVVIVAICLLAMPILAQETPSPWSAEVLDVRAETELRMQVGLSTTTYTAVNDFVFYIVEIALTYTNATNAPVQVDVVSDQFELASQAGQVANASGTAGPGGGCVDCVTTFPLDVPAGEQVTLNIPLVFVVAGDDRIQRFTLTFEDMDPMAVLLGDGSAGAAPTPTPRPTATPAPRFGPTPEGTLEPSPIDAPFCDQMVEDGEIDADGTYLCIQGDPNDWASSGQKFVLVPSSTRFGLGCPFNDRGVCITAGDWEVSFEPSQGELFGVGLFEGAQRIPFAEAGHPGLSITGLGGCNEINGTFEVRELAVDEATGDVTTFAAIFEQYCDSDTVRLRGMVRWEADTE